MLLEASKDAKFQLSGLLAIGEYTPQTVSMSTNSLVSLHNSALSQSGKKEGISFSALCICLHTLRKNLRSELDTSTALR